MSDDPDTYVEPTDLFEEQKCGLTDIYGKKDKATTEQAYFVCRLCECDLKSIKTLRDHCKGSKHVRKALQAKMEYRARIKKEQEGESSGVSSSSKIVEGGTLFHQLESTSETVVGLDYITEFTSGDRRDDPLYHCSMEDCRDEQGDAESMKRHILSLRHRQSFIYLQTGSYLTTQTEILTRLAELTTDHRRNYQAIRVRQDWEAYRKVKLGRYRERKIQKEDKQDYDRDFNREDRRRDYRDRGSYREDCRGDYRDRGSHREDSRDYRDRGSFKEERRDYRIPKDFHRENRRDEYRAREDRRDMRSRSRSPRRHLVREEKRSQERYEDRMYSDRERERREDRPQPPTHREADLLRSADQGESSNVVSSTVTTIEEEDVKRLHARVAHFVMSVLNKYYPGSEEFKRGLYKIGSAEEYSKLAKQFSHNLRGKIKESYSLFNNGSLEGIRFTGDNEVFIRTEVDSYFEQIPLIKRC